MRVATLGSAVVMACLVLATPAQASPAANPTCVGKAQNQVILEVDLDSNGCPVNSIRTDPSACLEAEYGSTWPQIQWADRSPQSALIGWTLTPVATNTHAHFSGPITIQPANDLEKRRADRAGHPDGTTCIWHYTVSAWTLDEAGNQRCPATLDPGIKFKPGGGGGAVYLWFLLGAGMLLAWYLFQRQRRRRTPSTPAR